MVLVVYMMLKWRNFFIFCGFSGLAYVALLFKFLWEFFRWYLVIGKVDKVYEVMIYFVRGNLKFIG